jgi:rare lipoprotein A
MSKILSSLAAALIVATLGAPLSGHAEMLGNSSAGSAAELDADAEPPSSSADSNATLSDAAASGPSDALASEGIASEEAASEATSEGTSEGTSATAASETPDATAAAASESAEPTESTEPTVKIARSAIKVGARQAESADTAAAATIAQIEAHRMQDREAATVYVRGIPVFTFLGEQPFQDSEAVKVGETTTDATEDAKVASAGTTSSSPTPSSSLPSQARSTATGNTNTVDAADPVQQATTMAAQINQLYQSGIDPSLIEVEWREGDRYVITVADEPLLELGAGVMLSDTTDDPAEDALQAANRLRRLLGGAEPLTTIEGMPVRSRPASQQARRPFSASGLASWYGPGFNGRRSASGEIFNQNALTAAHRTLPFGTRVRVTNVNTGEAVVVRINDRGPFHGNRIIDLSAAAARAIGLMRLGVAPVQIDIVDPTTEAE